MQKINTVQVHFRINRDNLIFAKHCGGARRNCQTWNANINASGPVEWHSSEKHGADIETWAANSNAASPVECAQSFEKER